MSDDDFESFALSALPQLLRSARALTMNDDDAWDLLQDTMVRVGLHWQRIDAERNPLAYARSALVRLSIDSHRRSARARRALQRLASLGRSSISTAPDVDGVEPWLVDAWWLISPNQRAVIAMRYLDDASNEEIARTLDCSEATVRSHLSRGLSRLRASAPNSSGTVNSSG